MLNYAGEVGNGYTALFVAATAMGMMLL